MTTLLYWLVVADDEHEKTVDPVDYVDMLMWRR